MHGNTVVVAMSGGVDSAVAAALLRREGWDVIGITLQIWQERAEQGRHGGCCSLGAVEDARRAAAKIGIPHYVLNFREFFADSVISNFVSEYVAGRTPNPCVECNRTVKFQELLKQAEQLGADYLATGHYARVRRDPATGLCRLLSAKDSRKDQSYALYTLTQEALSRTLMPIGELASKDETRRVAAELGLAVANKPDSQEICFVPREGYTAFLREKAPEAVRPGNVVDRSGAVLGEHPGIAFYTVGQRKRLPSGFSQPLFVLDLEPATNTVVVGPEEELLVSGLVASRCVWSCGEPPSGEAAGLARIRYNAPAVPAAFRSLEGGRVECWFDEPQRAVTPGQSVVLYGTDGVEAEQVVLGGGIIERPLKRD